jgi:hypothetical protein
MKIIEGQHSEGLLGSAALNFRPLNFELKLALYFSPLRLEL